MVLEVSLRLGERHRQCLLIPLQANLWRQLDLLFSIHGQSYAYTHRRPLTRHTNANLYKHRNRYVCWHGVFFLNCGECLPVCIVASECARMW